MRACEVDRTFLNDESERGLRQMMRSPPAVEDTAVTLGEWSRAKRSDEGANAEANEVSQWT